MKKEIKVGDKFLNGLSQEVEIVYINKTDEDYWPVGGLITQESGDKSFETYNLDGEYFEDGDDEGNLVLVDNVDYSVGSKLRYTWNDYFLEIMVIVEHDEYVGGVILDSDLYNYSKGRILHQLMKIRKLEISGDIKNID